MSTTNLLNLDVDLLFEQHSVPEIEIIQRKVREVADGKREELRTMVGERYRDLLQAADTINAMEVASVELLHQVKCITENSRKFNEQNLLNFHTTTDDNNTVELLHKRQRHKQQSNYFSIMIQIKLLTELPELIWSNIDQEHFCTATELFTFSRHISTGLQLDVNNKLMQRLPVAKKQWEILKPFHMTIKQHVIMVLEREELKADVAVDCLLSLLLLEKNNLNNILKTFLQLRCAAFLNCLNDAERKDVEKRRVKERILDSYKVLVSTVDLMGKCFLENGLLLQKLATLTDPYAPPTIALLDIGNIKYTKILPEIIANFRPKYETQTLIASQVCTAFEQWLTDTKRIAEVQLKSLFELITTMNAIQEIKTSVHAYRKDFDFTPIVEKFELKQTINFYELKYVPLINQRVHDIIYNSWLQAIQNAFDTLEVALKNVATKNIQEIWLENLNDLPLSLEEALNDDRKMKKLLMKTKGFDNEIINLCATFDKQLSYIISEMNILLEEQVTKMEYKLKLIEFLRNTAQMQINEFMKKVQKLNLMENQRKELLLVLRTYIALIELCPNLKICYCQQSSWRQWLGNLAVNNMEYWQRLCVLIEEESFNIWQQIVNGILKEHNCAQILPQNVKYDVILNDFANWDTVSLEQKDEQENTINSNLRIPSQPSISLQLYLYEIISALNNEIPQTLPTKVLKLFNKFLLTQLIAHYEQLIKQLVTTTTTTNQNIALQFYFDLKFLQNIFIITRDERILNEQMQIQQNALKDLIDPFDFELFAEHIKLNVKRSIARLNCQLGVLIINTPTQTTTTTTTATTTVLHAPQDKDPNVLSLSTSGSTSLWFPLLPIIAPNAYALDNRTLNEKQTTPTRKATAMSSTAKKNETTTSLTTTTTTSAAAAAAAATTKATTTTLTKSKSGAASFFGAMSQDWFR